MMVSHFKVLLSDMYCMLGIVLLCSLAACGPPRLQGTWPLEDRIVVVEDGVRKDLRRVIISWPGFPTSAPLHYLAEESPQPDAISLQRFDSQCSDWRRIEVLNLIIDPIIYTRRTQDPYAQIVLSIHPIVIGVAAEPVAEVSQRPDLFVRPVDLENKTRIVRLLHASRFPDHSVRTPPSWGDDERMATLVEAIHLRVVDLDRAFTIDEAMQYVEDHEEFHQVESW